MRNNLLLSIIISILTIFTSYSSHILGGEVTYRFLDNQGPAGTPFRYEITFRVYNNRDGQVPDGIEQNFGYAIYDAANGAFVEYRTPAANIIYLNPDVPPGCNVPGVTNFRITLNEFVDVVNLPFSLNGFDVIWERGTRLNGINNILNSGNEGSTFRAFIPSSIYNNTSPQFSDRPIPAMCTGDTTTFVNNAFDPDGDQLVYRLGNAYGMNFWGGGQFAPFNDPPSPQIYNNYNYPPPTLPYVGGYSGTSPFGPSGYAFINSSTGLSKYYSPNGGNYVVNVFIDEYRTIGGVPTLISTTSRELQLFISNLCQPNQNPVITSSINTSSINIYEGDSIEFTINSNDPDLDNVNLNVTGAILDTNSGYTGPLATFVVNGAGDEGIFNWQTECGMNGSYQLNFQSVDNGCPPKTINNIYTINVLPFEASNIVKVGAAGNDTVCSLDDSSIFRTVGPNTSNYDWKVTNGTIVSYNNDSTRIAISWGVPGNGRIDIVETNESGCKDSTFKIVNVKGADIINASEDTTICFGDSVEISAIGTSDYLWSSGHLLTDSLSANTIAFPEFSTNFIVTNPSSICYQPDTVNVTVNHITRNMPDDTTCMRDSIQIGLDSVSGYTYNWLTTDGLSYPNISNPNLALNESGIYSYIINIVDTNQCEGNDTLEILVRQTPDSVFIDGGISICPDAAGISYLVEDTNLTSFIWNVEGGILADGQGTDSITVDWAGSNPDAFVSLIPTDKYGCTGDTSKLPVVINEIIQIQLPDGPDTVCFYERTNLDYSIPYVNGSNYTWTISTNGIINSGQSTEEINVDWISDNNTYLFVEDSVRTISSTCLGKSDTLFVNVVPSPDTTLNIDGTFSICSFSDSISYSISGLDSSNYVWTLDTGGVIIDGQGTNSILIDWDTTGTYLISVFETTINGCLGKSLDTTITVRSIPSTSIDSSLNSFNVCLNLDSILYQVDGFNNSTYNWFVTGGDSILSSSNEAYVNWNESFIKGLKVVETSEFGCIGDTFNIIIDYDPSNIELVSISDNFDDETLIDLQWNRFAIDDTLTDDLVLYRRQVTPTLGTWDSIASISKFDNSYTDGPLATNENNYEYYLSTSNICLDSITTLSHKNVVVSGVADDAASTTNLTWNTYKDWSKFDGVKEYNIYRNLDNNGYELIETTSNLDSVIELTNGGDGFNHCYRIEAIQTEDEAVTSWSNEVCMTFIHDITVYNALTPNGDGKNDFFYAKNIWLYPDNQVQIFNRWGNLVFSQNSYNNNWDGGNLPDGVYYYVVKVTHNGEQLPIFKGDLLLQR